MVSLSGSPAQAAPRIESQHRAGLSEASVQSHGSKAGKAGLSETVAAAGILG